MYLCLDDIREKLLTFNFILGNRGGGKTYTTIKDSADKGIEFIYMRRTQKECERIAKKMVDTSLSPFEALNNDNPEYGFELERIDDGIYSIVKKEGKETIKKYGLMLALSAVATMRGFEYPKCERIIFDEFNPERHVRMLTEESDAFFNMYETINRNRELKGNKPIEVFLLGNANSIASPILETLELTEVIETMNRAEKKFYRNPDRDLFLMLMENAEFIEEKSKTALYKLTKGTKFYDMALYNKFAYDEFNDINKQNLKEYKLKFTCSKFAVWRHKSRNEYYITENTTGRIDYEDNKQDELALANEIRLLKPQYIGRKIKFKNFSVKNNFTKYC